MMKTIEIQCAAAISIDLRDLVPMQADLKQLTEGNFEKLKRSILKHGVTFPFFVWQSEGKNFILDGTQRDKVLLRMADEGYHIPPLPCALIEAKDRKEAAEKILLISSGYGKITGDSLYQFLSDNELDFPELLPMIDLPALDLEEFGKVYFEEPTYVAAGEDKQGRLDQKSPVTCPECGASFTPR